MSKIKTKKQKSVIILTLIAAISFLICAITAIGSFAAYTNSSRTQRTVATYGSQGERFSSGILETGYSKDNVQECFVPNSSVAPSKIITVCNYERRKQTKPYEGTITYSITARFVKYDVSDPNKYVPVNSEYFTANSLTAYTATLTFFGEDRDYTVTLSSTNVSDGFMGKTLVSEDPIRGVSHVYTITFSNNFAVADPPNLYVEVIVHPSNADLHDLCGVFKTGLRAPDATNDWTGDFSDDTAYAPSEYDGFNYRVMGVGKGTVTITWDGDAVSLSDESFKYVSENASDVTKVGHTITFKVDSDAETKYDLQFYKVNITDETWSDMRTEVVRFSFVG